MISYIFDQALSDEWVLTLTTFVKSAPSRRLQAGAHKNRTFEEMQGSLGGHSCRDAGQGGLRGSANLMVLPCG